MHVAAAQNQAVRSHVAIVLQAAEANAASLSKAQAEHSHLQKAVLGDLKCATSLLQLDVNVSIC